MCLLAQHRLQTGETPAGSRECELFGGTAEAIEKAVNKALIELEENTGANEKTKRRTG